MYSGNHFWILCFVFFCPGSSLPETLFDKAFTAIWNAPSTTCGTRYGITLDVEKYNIVQNKYDRFQGDKMVLFYEKQLGLYPHILPDGTLVHGGIPQLMSMKDHLNQAKKDVEKTIPSKNFSGPAVIDWENWRPLFERNFDSKRIYQRLAARDVQKQHPDWNKAQIENETEIQFDDAAKELMLSTLKLGEELRSNGRWGYYGFPRIYQKIPERTRVANDRLGWLFSASTALYPSIYLHSKIKTWLDNFHFVVDTLKEAFRIYEKFSDKKKSYVVPYVRFRHDHLERFYTEPELLLSLTLPAVTGSAGVLLWDSSHSFRDRRRCEIMKTYLTLTLGPFIKNLTNTFQHCSEQLCNSNGRCVKSWEIIGNSSTWTNAKREVNAFDHNNTMNNFEKRELQTLLQIMSNADVSHSYKREFNDMFDCKCYTDWKGKHCDSYRY